MKLTDWAQRASTELDLDQTMNRADVDRVLDLAKDAARGVARPAAPLTTYLLGVAVGRGADPADAAARLSRLANEQVES